jgi:hypothetical protein
MMSLLPALIILFAPAWLLGQAQDIKGTWTGEAVLPGLTEKSTVTLELEKTEKSYAGKISDSKSMFGSATLENVTFENNILKFKLTVSGGGRELKLRVTLNYFLGKLIGGWAIDEGAYAFAPLVLTRKS